MSEKQTDWMESNIYLNGSMDLDHGISWNNNSNQDFSQKLIKINFNAVTLCKKLEKFFASILKGPIFGPFCPKIPEKYFFSKNFD